MKKMIALLSAAVMAVAATAQMTAYAASTELAAIPVTNRTVTARDTSGYIAEVVRLVNQERSKRGLGELKMFPRLSRAAAIRADEITVSMGHDRPDGSGITALFSQLGIKWSSIGENLAKGQTTPEMVVNGWMNSEGHRENILKPEYKYIGVGVAESDGKLHWAQLFIDTTVAHPEAISAKDSGDVNGDSKVNAVDASLVLADYAATGSGKPSTFSAVQRTKADVNGDEAVNAVDASQILSVYAKNSTR